MTASPATAPPVVLGARGLTWDEYEAVVYGGARVELADDDGRLDASRRELDRQIAAGARVYAVTTGYGADAGRAIEPDALARVQLNTLRSHAVSVGEEVEQQLVRGMLAAKAQAFAQGPAGVRRVIVERLVELLNRRAHPLVYTQGSQSASGDLIPNAHVGLAVIGEGTVRVGAETLPASEVLGGTLALAPKEGVALTNDVSYATALAFDVVREGARLLERAELVAAMTLQALRGFPEAFDERLVATRPHPGALASAAHMRELLAGSELLRDGGRVHDPYSLRCIPQVHGAVRDALAYARAAIEVAVLGAAPNQISRLRPEVAVDAAQLLDFAATPGAVTEAGLRGNVRVGFLYLSNWLTGRGAAGIDNMMEDAATAEICRTQIWQWIRQGSPLEDGRPVTGELVRELLGEETERIRSEVGDEVWERGRPAETRRLFEQVALADELPAFLTLPAYELLP